MSSSPHPPADDRDNDDQDDEDDQLVDPRDDGVDGGVAAAIQSGLREPLFSRRAQKKASTSRLLASPARGLLSSLTGGSGPESAAPVPPQSIRRSGSRSRISRGGGDGSGGSGSGSSPSRKDGPAAGTAAVAAATAAGAPDWCVEGPGRRVGYDDLTAIDWIFEYTKERTRRRALAASSGEGALLGWLRLTLLLDSFQVWAVLVLTGLAVGLVAAAIDITTDWLGDLKLGFCAGGPEGGRFYLSKGFCCFGYDQGSKCAGWRSWGEAIIGGSAGSGESAAATAAAVARWLVEYIFFTVAGVCLASAAALLVQDYSVHARHSGIPEIKTVLGGFVIRRLLGAWTLITKSFGLCLAVASGMWLGKEGPLVHVACCCSNLFIKLFKNIDGNEARKREVLSAAAASGISVAFGSPIGGVLFSLEQLAYYFPDKTMWQSFVCAMTAAVMLQALDPFRSGKLVLYQVKYSTSWHGFELVPYGLLGILGGVYGGLFIRANMFVARWRRANSGWLPGPVGQVAAVALLTAVINFPNWYMRIQASEAVSNLFAECSQVLDDQLGLCRTGAASARTVILLLLAAALGSILATVTFGLQIPAGIILPSMAVGALVGRAVGILMELWVRSHPTSLLVINGCGGSSSSSGSGSGGGGGDDAAAACAINPGTYAIVGAAAALGGVTRMTVSIVVIMFELTGALTYVLPIMVAVMISKWVGDALTRRGIYESWIHFNEYPFLDDDGGGVGAGRGGDLLHLGLDGESLDDGPTAAEVMTRIEDLIVLTATGHTVGSLGRVLDAHPHRGFPVVSDPRDALLLGYISRAELAYNLATATRPPHGLPPEADAFFSHQPLADPAATLDLRPWMDQTPLTLPSRASLHLVVAYFQKLGLRYVLLCDRGALQGLLTKKDVWYLLNHAGGNREEGTEREEGGGSRRGGMIARGGADGLGTRSPAAESDDDSRGLLSHARGGRDERGGREQGPML